MPSGGGIHSIRNDRTEHLAPHDIVRRQGAGDNRRAAPAGLFAARGDGDVLSLQGAFDE
jgi:hypothetical protein